MAYGEARVAALSSSVAALQGKIDRELTLIAPDMAKLSYFKRKLNRLNDEIDSHRIKLASVV